MTWNPQGLLIKPNPAIWWMTTFAGPAAPLKVTNTHVRFFLTGRDNENVSRIGPVDVDFSGPSPRIIGYGEPVVDIGALGLFDSEGAAYPWLVEARGTLYLYYVGWLQGHKVAMHHGIGVATSSGWDQPFTKQSRAPILPLSDAEPYGSASCCVDYSQDGGWRMFYTSFQEWRMEAGGPKHYYSIRETTSEDGIAWFPKSVSAINHADASEYALGKPCLTQENGREVLYFVARGDRYRIWRAENRDGQWVRDTKPVAIPFSDWDSQMQAYPLVWSLNGQEIMLYNGNGYGRSGLGWATREMPAAKSAAA